MHQVVLPRIGTFAAWRTAARSLVAAGRPPGEVLWAFDGAEPSLFADPFPAGGAEVKATRPFLTLAETVSSHADARAFGHLYDVLWRLQRGPVHLDDRSDPAVGWLLSAEKAIRRDRHKMTAFVRFREIPSDGPRRRFAAWFEPSHHIVEATAPFFAKRFGDMDWAIATPYATARFEDGALSVGPTETPFEAEWDGTEKLWQTYFAHIFNPARLKISAMRAEMPQKYWRNLPEAELIPDLITSAAARTTQMRAAEPTAPAPHARAAVAMARRPDMDLFVPDSLEAAHAEARGCTRCPLHGPATQIVWGEGPKDAEIMIVGEQPGDQEDLEGRPFVGPAGQLFDRLAGEAGLDRGRAYVTNAVKHFKFTQRGKRRIHSKPASSEISLCRWWLDQERALVKPALTLAMGATSLHALTGDGRGILKRRGGVEPARDGGPVYVTVHPSYLLRLPDETARAREEDAFRRDVAAALAHLDELRAA